MKQNLKYPIGIQTFEKIIGDGYVYVDKTDLIYKMAHSGSIYFLSRPRRFGKSLLISTLDAYFSGRKELFEGLAIAELESEWKTYPVFRMDFNINFMGADKLNGLIESYLNEWERIYGKRDTTEDYALRLINVLRQAYEQTGRRCVVLIDEYDKPLLDVMDTDFMVEIDGNRMSLEEKNRNILKGFYSVFKTADAYLQFVLLTGVTKFSQVSIFSGFNQPKDITMDPRYETVCGITEEETERFLRPALEQFAENEGVSITEIKARLKRQYDGYHFSRKMTDVYNPFSVLNALDTMSIDSFWFKTGTPSYLMKLLSHSGESLDEMTGKWYPTQEFADYRAMIEKPLPMLYQSGYLTIKGYDPDYGTYLLDLPNNEVKDGLITMAAAGYFGNRTDENGSFIRRLCMSMEAGDTDGMRTLLTSFLAGIPYNSRRGNSEKEYERFFHYTLYLIFSLVSVYTVYTEKAQSKGRVGCIVETKKHVYIFEFKLDGSAEDALRQIEEKGYARPFGSDGRTVHKIGISFSSATGTVEGWAESDS